MKKMLFCALALIGIGPLYAYYWYGSHFREAEQYRQDPSVTYERNSSIGVSCYKSTDFVRWKDMGHVMTLQDITGGRGWAGWFCRMGDVELVREP